MTVVEAANVAEAVALWDVVAFKGEVIVVDDIRLARVLRRTMNRDRAARIKRLKESQMRLGEDIR